MNPIGSDGKMVWPSVVRREPERAAVWLEIEPPRFEEPPRLQGERNEEEDAVHVVVIDMC